MTRRIERIIACLLATAVLSGAAAGAQYLVSQDGTGTHGTIQGAMNAASYGDVIHVAPGVYQENVVFKNGVSLLGGGAGATVIRYGYGFEPVLRAEHASAGRIEGFSIERTETTLSAPAVLLKSASIEIVDCVISGGKAGGIEIAASTSTPTLVGVRLTANDESALWVHDGAQIELVSCRIDGNAGNGILLTDEAAATLRSTVITGNAAHGVAITGSAYASVIDAEVLDHAGCGIDVEDEGHVEIEASSLIGNALAALRLRDEATMLIGRSTISGGGIGIDAADRTEHRIDETTIAAASGTGIIVCDDATGTLARSEISACGSDGLNLSGTRSYTVDRATVVRNAGAGILIGGTGITITNTILAYNDGPGIGVERGAGDPNELLLSHNNVWANGGGDYVGVTPRTSDLAAPPDFVDLERGNLSLRPTSPCIDRGLLGETIGAHDDPSIDSTARIEIIPTIRDALLGLDISVFARFEPSPFELETVQISATSDGPRSSFSVSSSFLGSWGARTTVAATIGSSRVDFGTGSVSGRLDLSGVLDGLESRFSARFEADWIKDGFEARSSVSRVWPSTQWIQELELSLGSTLRAVLSASTADLVPRSLDLALEHARSTGTGTFAARGGLSLGADRLASASVDWRSEMRSFSATVSSYLDSPGYASATLALEEAATGLGVGLTIALSNFRFSDGKISISTRLESAELTACLGIDGLGHARAALRIEADLDSLFAPPPNLPPIPAFVVRPADPQAGEAIHFEATGSSDDDGEIVEYWWDFGDGDADLGAAVVHTFDEPGRFTVTLTLSDDAGATATLAQPLVVEGGDLSPVAKFLWEPVTASGTRLPRPLRAGDEIRLDATASYDPSGEPLEFHWDLDSDGAFDLIGEDPIVIAPPLDAGTHPVTLRVINETGRADAVMHAVTVSEPKPPRADFAFTPATPSILDPIRFSDLSSDADGSIVAWEWSFGDAHTSRDPDPIHRYEEPGNYAVSLTVTDDDGLEAVLEVPVVVARVPEIVVTGDVWILAIGISDYANVADLEYASADAIAAAQWALDEGVPEDHMRLLTDSDEAVPNLDGLRAQRATLVNVRESLGWIRRMAHRDDLVIIFFSGHGYQGADDGNDERDGVDEFFVLLDTVDSAVDDTALRDDEFGRFLDRIASEHVLVFFDGCYSGGLARSLPSGRRPTGDALDLFRDFSLEGRLVLSATTESQDAFESPTLGHGVFTHFVLEGLRGEADLNDDNHVTAWEVYEYVAAEVPPFVRRERGAEQVPQIVGQGDVRVLLSSRQPPPAAAFSYTPTIPYAGGQVRFRDESTGEIALHRWTFDSGPSSAEANPVHVFEEAGAFSVSLAVTDPAGARSDATLVVYVAPPGHVVSEENGLWIISLGATNGVAVGDRFRVVSDDGTDGTVLEVVELLDADRAACRMTSEAAAPPAADDLLRPI